jgi:cardiolipin synthase (CMP-forming)
MKGESRAWRTIPNLLTATRILLIAPFAWLCIRGHDVPALVVFFLAGLTDALDGRLARQLHQRSKFGRLADPLADKLLTTVSFLALSLFRTGGPAIPLWVTVAVISRDVLIVAGALVVYAHTRSTAFEPHVFGKANTFFELAVIVFMLAASRLRFLSYFMPGLYILLTVTLLLSATDYAAQGVRMIRESRAGRRELKPLRG